MLVSANEKVSQKIELFPTCLEARNLVRPSYRPSHQPLGADIGVLMPGPSCTVGESHGIDLALRLSNSGVPSFRYFFLKLLALSAVRAGFVPALSAMCAESEGVKCVIKYEGERY